MASTFQANNFLATPADPPSLRGQAYQTTDAWGMPPDLPLPVSERHGTFQPATAADSDLRDYDPWSWANVAKMVDDSRPLIGPYGEVSTPGKSGALVAEWGGMPDPVKNWQDTAASVLLVPRQASYHTSAGPAGRFYGGQQTAYEAQATTPAPDYWSTLIGGVG